MPQAFSDLRFACRNLLRSRGFTALAVVTLAAGIGGTTALFSLVDAVLFRPLPYKDPGRLVEIWGHTAQRTGMRVPLEILQALRARSTTLQAIGTHDPSGGVLATAEGHIDIRGEAVSANFVDVFGVQPLAGRAFVPDDERAGSAPVMLVSFAFAQQYLGGRPDAVGRVLHLDGVPYEVVGIMPKGFETRFEGSPPAFWTPYAGNSSRQRERELGYEIVARLAPGATLDRARREVEAIAGAAEFAPWRQNGRTVGVVALRDEIVGGRATALKLLLAAAALVLAVACANLAQLLLARSDGRVREFATRQAIGAAPRQIFRLALFESLLLAAAGGGAGVATAHALVPAMIALAPVEIPRLAEASVDVRVLLVAAAVSVVTGCVFGLAPALRLSRLSVVQAMRPGAGLRSGRRRGAPSMLIVVQVAAAVVLFVLATLVSRTFLTLFPASPGFATDGRASFIWSVSERQFPDAGDRRRRVLELMERLERVPGILSVAVASRMPFGDDESRNAAVRHADDRRPPDEGSLRTDIRAVSPNYFELLEIPLLRGRQFDTADRAEAPHVAIVNRTLAHQLEPSGNVLGSSIRLGTAAAGPTYQIVGVVADTRWWGMTLEPLNEVYTPLAQDRAGYGFVIVHSRLDAEGLTAQLRSAFYAAFPGAALPRERTVVSLEDRIARSVAAPRFSALVMGSLSVVTLFLSAIGLFGLVAYSVSQRRGELGIRMALGARPADLLLLNMRAGLVLTGAGIIAGLLASAYLTRLVESQLYGIGRLDPVTYAGAGLLMLLTAGAATYFPARQAVRTDPMTVLRRP